METGARPGEVWCSSCSGLVQKENPLLKEKMAAHLRSLKGKKPSEGRGCPACARLALKELNLNENKEKTTKKNPLPEESKLLVADAGSEEESSKPAAKKRKKKVTVRMGKEYVEYLEKHPLPPPRKPVRFDDWILSDLQDSFIAQKKAAREAREKIIKQYKEHGYATREVEVTDDEGDEEL